MKTLYRFLPCIIFLAVGCTHPAGSLSGPGLDGSPGRARPQAIARPGLFLNQAEFFRVAATEEDLSETEDLSIADPLEPFNRAMFTFNDRLYFWVLKPVAEGYGKVVPETARVSVRNFFDNLKFPIRFVNNILQANFEGAVSELGRFSVNTVWGIGGLLDPSSKEELAIRKYDADLGQTLGVYGVGQGFYIVYPVLGPSSVRDTASLIGDAFLDPVTYLNPWYAWIGTKVYENVNSVSLRIGDYESLTEAAIDPYLALRDAYVQYREKKIQQRGTKAEPPKPGGVR